MPNIKSAKKRVNVIKTKTEQNKRVRTSMKTAIKKAHEAIDNNVANKEEIIREAYKKIDQAQAKGIIHSNNAAHKKSAIAKKANN